MEQTECFETSAYKIQMPGNHPKETIQHSGYGESLKSRTVHCSHLHSVFLCFLRIANWNKSDTKSLSHIAFDSLSVVHKIARVKVLV